MSLLQMAYRTYERHAHLVGREETGKEPLAPVSHAQQNAQIEITIGFDGAFISARPVGKQERKTLIPVTIASTNRTGGSIRAHPLSDQLRYLAPFGEKRFEIFLEQLTAWDGSEHAHPKVRAVLRYVQKGGIVDDLAEAGVITRGQPGHPGEGKIEGKAYAECLVRWRVEPSSPAECWRDASLFDSHIAHCDALFATMERDVCMIAGTQDIVCPLHPKGIVEIHHDAKLISTNDEAGYTFRGRFVNARQAYSVGYTASQKAHVALRWLVANQGVAIGGRTFLTWNPEGQKVPAVAFKGSPFGDDETQVEPSDYQARLRDTLNGYRLSLKPEDDVVIASMDAATTGRLAVTYYNALKASDFLERLEHWYTTFTWNHLGFEMSPPLQQIVHFAFGAEQGEWMDTGNKTMRENIQRLLHCVVDRQPLPRDIVRALTDRAGWPQAYTEKNHKRLVNIACAAIRKYRNQHNKEEWTLTLHTANSDRSYLFGRLLAAMELAERTTYQKNVDDERETNAMRLMSVYVRRPMETAAILRERLVPYLIKLPVKMREFFHEIMDAILGMLDPDDSELNEPLDEVYLLGYSHQRTTIFAGKQKLEEDEKKGGQSK